MAASSGHAGDNSGRKGSAGRRTAGGGRGQTGRGRRNESPRDGRATTFEQGRAGRREPAGIDRARQTPGAPPRRRPPAAPTAATKPDLPADHEPDLPPGVRRQLRRAGQRDSHEVEIALSLGSAALEDERPDAALPYLEWAKGQAPSVAAVREALGVARYLAEDFAGAAKELQAYRRISGNVDQNHVLADCQRALGRDLSGLPELIGAMEGTAPGDRVTEGIIVWASALADRGELAAGRALVERRAQELTGAELEEHHLRLWYVCGDLAERAGDRDEAHAWFGRITEASTGFFDADERLAALT